MPTLDLDSRLSVPTRQLATPGPDAAQLQRILRSAVRVPDHGKRVPFRFLRIAGPARALLAAAAAERLREREPDAGEAVIDKLRTRFLLPHAGVRGVCVRLQDTWRDILSHAEYPEITRGLLGQSCAAATLFTGHAKVNGRLSLQLRSRHAALPRTGSPRSTDAPCRRTHPPASPELLGSHHAPAQ